MASCTQIHKRRKQLKARKSGRKRKNLLAKKGTTPSKAEFFGDQKAASKA